MTLFSYLSEQYNKGVANYFKKDFDSLKDVKEAFSKAELKKLTEKYIYLKSFT